MKLLYTTSAVAVALMIAGGATVVGSKVSVAEERGYSFSEAGENMRGEGRRGFRQRVARLFERFDANEDRQVTQAEIDTVVAERFATADTNSDSSVTLEEFEGLWLQDMRERMVDRFQRLDANGDGSVTTAEFNDHTRNIVDRLDRNGDGVLSRDDRGGRGGRGDGGRGPRGDDN